MHLFILVSSLHYLCKTKLNYHKTTISFFSEQGIIPDERRRTGSLSKLAGLLKQLLDLLMDLGNMQT